MKRILNYLPTVNRDNIKKDAHDIFLKMIRTRDVRDTETDQDEAAPGKQRLTRCLTTMDLTSLGVGSCVGTGMYLVVGMVAHKFAGPGVAISFCLAALASLLSGACYAEFGARVPNTTGSAYMYAYVTVGEFVAFLIGWNMILEYLIGTSACARALSACFNALGDGVIGRTSAKVGTVYGAPLDIVACGITLLMMFVLMSGVKKSLFFNNLLNSINFVVWVFIMAAGLFYVDFSNWTEHKGFLPYGWNGVFTGAATCFYAFIGFDIIATTGSEAINPKRSIPLAIVSSLGIILLAYVSTSLILTLIVPYDEVETDSALLQMFAHVNAPICKYIVSIGALAGLTVSMFGSMFPLPRIIYAMSLDKLFVMNDRLSSVSDKTGAPKNATICGGASAAIVALFVRLEVLVEMMSIGTLIAYTLIATCVLILRYQQNYNNLIELLPQRFRFPLKPEGTANTSHDTNFPGQPTHIVQGSQRVMVRRVTRSSPDSDDTLPGDESEDYGREDTFLINNQNGNEYYGAYSGGSCGSTSRCGRFIDYLVGKLRAKSYLCPGIFPWVEVGPATEQSGMFVIKAVGVMYILIIIFDILAAYGNPGSCTTTTVLMVFLFLGIFVILLMISRKPQNRELLIYTTPGLPFVPAIAIIFNIYLMLNLSVLSIIRFFVWMTIGLFFYFKFAIGNSKLETKPSTDPVATPPPANPMDRIIIPPPSPSVSQTTGDRNIFEGDGNNGFYGNLDYAEELLTWHVTEPEPVASSSRGYKHIETRYDPRTNSTTSHTSSRPPWAYPDALHGNWD